MKKHYLLTTALSICFAVVSHNPALSNPGISAVLGAGYSDNLYADSFALGNSYLYNGVNISSTHFEKTRVKLLYELTYYEYDTNNLINNFAHSPGIAVYRSLRGSRLKWSAILRGFIKRYTSDNSTFDNSKYSFDMDMSYFVKRGLQLRCRYHGELSSYKEYNVLENTKHKIEVRISRTFITKTTLSLYFSDTIRIFEDGSNSYDWYDLGIQIAQSLNRNTGVSISYLRRSASDGSRPLSTFYIISGVSASWDSWEGDQAELSLKRILPFGILSRLEVSLWDRKFNYDDKISGELSWLEGKSSRNDNGITANFIVRKQFNIKQGYGKYIAILLSCGFGKNSSDDDYYSYDDYYVDCSLEYSLF